MEVSTHTQIQIGAEFLGYRIEELIGQGGMGVVYRAYDLRLKRTVALKLIAPELALDERFHARFARETELAMSLEHPNVVPVYDAGDVDGRFYLAMRLVEGTDLGALLRAEGALEPARAIAICGQVANALDAAHAKGLVHRDVKPSNILLDESEHVYLADFGLTRRLEEQGAQAGEGRSVGTPAYLAPEQIEGVPVDGRADVYSLGCVLYECVTGKTPFVHGSRLAMAWAHLEDEPPSVTEHDSELPEAFDTVIRRALAKTPGDRYPTCAALVAEAGEALGFSRRRRRGALVALVVLVALVAVVAAALLSRDGGAPSVVPASLVKIDVETNEIVDVIPVGRNPGEVEVVGDYVFVASVEDATLSRVDTRTGNLTNSGRHAADGSIARQGDRWLWVASESRHEVSQVDVESLRSFTSLPLPETPYGESAFIGVGGGSLWVSTFQPPLIERWQLRTLRLERRYPLVWGNSPDWPLGVAFGYGAAWVGLGAPASDLLRIDAQTGRTQRIPVGGLPGHPVVGFGSVWVTTWDEKWVYRVDPFTRQVREKVEVGNKPIGVAVGAGSVWVANHCDGTVSRIDPGTNTVVETIETGYHPQWLAVGNGFVWVGISGEVYFTKLTCPE